MKPKNWFQTEKLTWNRKIDLKPRNWFKTRKLIWKRKIDLKTKNWFEIEKHKNLYWCYRKTKFEMQRVWKSILLSGTTLSKKKNNGQLYKYYEDSEFSIVWTCKMSYGLPHHIPSRHKRVHWCALWCFSQVQVHNNVTVPIAQSKKHIKN